MTDFLDKVYQRVDFDRELVFKFFTVFSLFEHALKAARFLKEDATASANWDRFADEINLAFQPNKSPELQKAVAYFEAHPPKKQMVKGGVLVFRAYSFSAYDAKTISVYIRCVRNNLFHGGKFCYERPRDTELIQHALVVLNEWARLNPDVHQALKNII